MSLFRENFLFNITVLYLEVFPEFVDMIQPVFFQHSPTASRVTGQHPPYMMNKSKNQFDEHLSSTIYSYYDENNFTIAIWSCVWLCDHNIYIDAKVSEEGVPEQPMLSKEYHAETKKTLSCSYVLPPC